MTYKSVWIELALTVVLAPEITAPFALATTPVSPVLELMAAAIAMALPAALLDDAKVLVFVSEAAVDAGMV